MSSRLDLAGAPRDARDRPLLSIVVIFHNSIGRMEFLPKTLLALSEPDVECVLVDDGSKDATPDRLSTLQAAMRCKCIVVRQDNQGPGAARNNGVAHAQGKYVWFVDCDDDINLDAMAFLREREHLNYDFIDFEVEHFVDTSGVVRPSLSFRARPLRLAPGAYRTQDVTRLFLLRSVGWIWSKMFRRDFLNQHALTFPQHCFYEDTPWFFWLPFLADRFCKSDVVAYYHHQEHQSQTRTSGRRPPRFYDRLHTASLAIEALNGVARTEDERTRIEDKFTNIFLIHTIEMLRVSGEWGMMLRVVRFYREEVTRLELSAQAARRAVSKMRLLVPLWLLSYCYPSQAGFFRDKHRQAWNMTDVVLAPVRFAKQFAVQ